MKDITNYFRKALTHQKIECFDGTLSAQSIAEIEKTLLIAKPREAIGVSLDNGKLCTSILIALSYSNLVACPLPPTMPKIERDELWKKLGIRFAFTGTKPESINENQAPIVWPEEIGWIVHSSGSTGIPKAIALSEKSILKNAFDTMNALSVSKNISELTHIGTMSQCYTNGLFNSFLIPVITEGRAVIGPVVSGLKFTKFAEMIDVHQPDILWVNPAVVKMFIKAKRKPRLKKNAVFISCTSPLSQADCIEAEKLFETSVVQSYGLSETLIVSIERIGRNPAEEFSSGSIISPEVSIQNSQIVISNGAVTPGYAQVSGAKIEFSLPDGGTPGIRYITNDFGRIDSQNRLYIEGRSSNVINVDGAKISPEALEDIMKQHPLIKDIAVCGVWDDGREKPIAVLEGEKKINDEELAQICIQHFGVKARPAAFVSVSALPRTSNGKLDRVRLKQEAAQLYKSAENR